MVCLTFMSSSRAGAGLMHWASQNQAGALGFRCPALTHLLSASCMFWMVMSILSSLSSLGCTTLYGTSRLLLILPLPPLLLQRLQLLPFHVRRLLHRLTHGLHVTATTILL